MVSASPYRRYRGEQAVLVLRASAPLLVGVLELPKPGILKARTERVAASCSGVDTDHPCLHGNVGFAARVVTKGPGNLPGVGHEDDQVFVAPRAVRLDTPVPTLD